jgi:glutamine---fructose-6-phosphate transaminase (isomerizing)
LQSNIKLLESPIVLQKSPRYVTDIRAQPQALQALLDRSPDEAAKQLLGRLPEFDRVIMTGMGASLYAQYPAFLTLAAAGLPVWWIETSELLGEARSLLTAGSLLWITSQSGRSAEVVALLSEQPSDGPAVLGVTNDLTSPLAEAADAVIELCSGEEHTVGTRSYVNSLAAHLEATAAALARPVPRDLYDMPRHLDAYLSQWDGHMKIWASAVRESIIFSLGRGTSLAATMTGALIVKEAAKVAMEGMSASQFRHGPLEVADDRTCAILLPGTAASVPLIDRLAADLTAVGANAVQLQGWGLPGDRPWLPDAGSAQTLPIAEIIPFQLLSVVLAERQGLEPGMFRQIAKVTTVL